MNAHTPNLTVDAEAVIADGLRLAMPSAAGHEGTIARIALVKLQAAGLVIQPKAVKKPKVKTYNREEVAEVLRKEINAFGGRPAFAEEVDVPQTHLGQVLNDGAQPCGKILGYLGYETAGQGVGIYRKKETI